MREIYPSIERIVEILKESKNFISSVATKSIYDMILAQINYIFRDFNKDDIVINKKEYVELLKLKKDDLIINYNNKVLNIPETVIELKSINDKIKYLEL